MATTKPAIVPGFRNPWQGGAKAYHEADSFAAALEGFKRKRKNVIFHMRNDFEAGRRHCAMCKGRLSAPAKAYSKAYPNGVRSEGSASEKRDKWSTWHYDAKRKKIFGGMHYVCSWGDLMGRVSSVRYI